MPNEAAKRSPHSLPGLPPALGPVAARGEWAAAAAEILWHAAAGCDARAFLADALPAVARALQAPLALVAAPREGRWEVVAQAGAARALAWYDEYLTRAPSGPFASEALGRKMTLIERLQGPDRARPLAEEYLRLFPKGNYAGAARTLMRAP
mgnify:CR=1 FL=1